jgi:hypothetical protein
VCSSSKSCEQLPFRLDERVPARYVSFQVLRNLIHRIGRYGCLSYSAIADRPIEAIWDVWIKEDGRVMRRATRYHHLNALKILGLVRQTPAGYALSPSGQAIAQLSADDTTPLSPECRRLFREAVCVCEMVRRNFFVLFTGSAERDPWEHGEPVSLHPIPAQRTYELVCASWPGRLRLSGEQTLGIIWGLRHWCLALDLVDEIFIRPQADVESDRANIIFPVDVDRAGEITVEHFDGVLCRHLLQAEPIYGDTVAISIPLLFYRLCPAERIPVESAKSLLRRWLLQYPEHAFVEAPSFSVLEAGRFRRGPSREVWRKQEEAFLMLGDRVYSRLLVSRALWSVKGGLYPCQ